ncbi:MAG: hypothetical protein KF851_15025 [Pirellulaceae bacterium]|nr:hypothetical protein [Pirellulaceae bacterium]
MPVAGQIEWSLSPTQLHWEQVLDRSHSDLPSDAMLTAEGLCRWLTSRGIPTLLDQSAIDDELAPTQQIHLNLASLPLRDRLLIALGDHNATLVYRENHVLIVSADLAKREEYFSLIVYDISRLSNQEDTAFWFTMHITRVSALFSEIGVFRQVEKMVFVSYLEMPLCRNLRLLVTLNRSLILESKHPIAVIF